jgi:hypothetical protein
MRFGDGGTPLERVRDALEGEHERIALEGAWSRSSLVVHIRPWAPACQTGVRANLRDRAGSAE